MTLSRSLSAMPEVFFGGVMKKRFWILRGVLAVLWAVGGLTVCVSIIVLAGTRSWAGLTAVVGPGPVFLSGLATVALAELGGVLLAIEENTRQKTEKKS